MIKIYGLPVTRTFRVLWTAEELGVAYEHEQIPFDETGVLGPDYRQINPMAKVPSLVDGDFVLSESAAICTYLADQHPDKGLAPEPRTKQRALYDQWLSFLVTELEQALWLLSKHSFVYPEALRVPAICPVAKKEFERPAAVLAKALEGRDYLVGERFTVADIIAVHTLNWATVAKVPLGHEVLEAYQAKHRERPAFGRVRAVAKG